MQKINIRYKDNVTSEVMRNMFKDYIGDRLHSGFNLEAQNPATLSLDLSMGDDDSNILFVNGIRVEETEDIVGVVTLSAGDIEPRIDVIACCYEYGHHFDNATYVVIEGTPASEPVPPELPDEHHIKLAEVHVSIGATEIESGDIYNEPKLGEQGIDIEEIVESLGKKIMTSDERNKLGDIEDGANNYTHPATHNASIIELDSVHYTSETVDAAFNEINTKVNDIRADHTKAIRLENRTNDPASPAVGRIWFRTDI